jgi:uncharacterized membrane protein
MQRRRITKTTILSGIFTLVPAIFFFIVLENAFHLVNHASKPLARFFRLPGIPELTLLEIASIIIVLFICVVFGFYIQARFEKRRWARFKIESRILMHLPGFSFIETMHENLEGINRDKIQQLVMVRCDGLWQLGCLFEQVQEKKQSPAIYIPGIPDPWVGTMYFLRADNIELLNSGESSLPNNTGQCASELLAKNWIEN